MSNQPMEKIDSSQMEILSEFLTETDKPEEKTAYRIGVLGENFIIASQAERAKRPDANVVPPDFNERQKFVFEYLIARNWWSGDIFFELQNYNKVLESITKIYDPTKPQIPDAFEIQNGQDDIIININSVFPHNAGKPIVTLHMVNYREGNMDLGDDTSWHIYLPLETGKRIMQEMQNIALKIKNRLENY